jgi:NADP-dependent 3-hydroxy acid dehydrogenase YdfG
MYTQLREKQEIVDLQLIVVTGASGILGRSIIEALTDANLAVGRAVRNPDMIGAMTASANLFSRPTTAVGKGTICHFRPACG